MRLLVTKLLPRGISEPLPHTQGSSNPVRVGNLLGHNTLKTVCAVFV